MPSTTTFCPHRPSVQLPFGPTATSKPSSLIWNWFSELLATCRGERSWASRANPAPHSCPCTNPSHSRARLVAFAGVHSRGYLAILIRERSSTSVDDHVSLLRAIQFASSVASTVLPSKSPRFLTCVSKPVYDEIVSVRIAFFV